MRREVTDGSGPRPDRARTRRVLRSVIALVLAGNALVLLTGLASDAPFGDGAADDRDVAVAALALAGTADVAVEADLDPLAGITVGTAPIAVPVDLGAELPVPLAPPSNPYANEPEIRHGLLEIPAIGLSQPFFEGVSLTAINRGPSHWPGTAMPGEVGNVVIAGHRTTYTRPFWDLQAVAPGDELIFTMTDGTRHVYELVRTEVVSPSDIHIVDQTPERTATLFGCHPRGSARQRIVGHFRLKPETRTVTVADTHHMRAPTS